MCSRRVLLAALALSLIWAAAGCTPKTITVQPPADVAEEQPLKGVWIAYYELPFQGLSSADFELFANGMMSNLALGGFNTVFCQVRPYCDAIYPSGIFPWSNAQNRAVAQGTDPGYDPLEILIAAAGAHGLAFHAWINPYRVATALPCEGRAWEYLAKDNPARLWLTDSDTENDHWVVILNQGQQRSIYLNPAIGQVNRLICDGVREILENYRVDGIHFDDYFYPTVSPDFDSVAFEQYKAEGGSEELSQWRRNNVSAMMSSVYSVVHSYGKAFGVSPAAAVSSDNTDRNYTELYADIRLWAARSGYVDYVIPQLYFGYEYPLEQYRFTNLLAQWLAIERHSGLKIYIGLGAYKQGTEDAGSREWLENSDIIFRQSADCLKSADGYAVFSYTSLFK